MSKITVSVVDAEGDQTYDFDLSSLTSPLAAQRAAEAAYCISLIGHFKDRARFLSELRAESDARETRQNEKRG